MNCGQLWSAYDRAVTLNELAQQFTVVHCSGAMSACVRCLGTVRSVIQQSARLLRVGCSSARVWRATSSTSRSASTAWYHRRLWRGASQMSFCFYLPRLPPCLVVGLMVSVADLRSRYRGFYSRPARCQVSTLGKLFTHMSLSPSGIIRYRPQRRQGGRGLASLTYNWAVSAAHCLANGDAHWS